MTNVLKNLSILFFSCLFCFSVSANDYDDAWTAIRNRKFSEAKDQLLKALKNPATATNAYLTLLYLETYNGNEVEIPGLTDQIIKTEGKDAYIYATWFNGSLLGQYSKKQSYQLNFLNKIISDKSFNDSIQAADHYVKTIHYLFSHDYDKSKEEFALTGAIQDWQLAGPFENLSGSGFNTNNGPLSNAEANAKFIAADNIEVSWFTPFRLNKQGWTFTYSHIPEKSAVVYAQTFVISNEEEKVMLN